MSFWNAVYLVAGFIIGYNFGVPIAQFIKDFVREIKG